MTGVKKDQPWKLTREKITENAVCQADLDAICRQPISSFVFIRAETSLSLNLHKIGQPTRLNLSKLNYFLVVNKILLTKVINLYACIQCSKNMPYSRERKEKNLLFKIHGLKGFFSLEDKKKCKRTVLYVHVTV